MLFDDLMMPRNEIVPLGIAILHAALCLYIMIIYRQISATMTRFFVAFLLATTLWDVVLMTLVDQMPWLNISLAIYLPIIFVIMGCLYWAFAQSFLGLAWRWGWGWWVSGISLILLVSLPLGWLERLVPPAVDIGLAIAIISWTIFFWLILFSVVKQHRQTRNPAHRNRIRYLFSCLLLLIVGYGMYLSQRAPLITLGLIVAWLGSVLTTYIVTIEDLVNLSTGVRRTLRTVSVVLVTIAVYLVGIYLVQFFLEDFLVTVFNNRIDTGLLIAAVSAVLLTIVYTPIRQLTERVTNRLLFGRRQDNQVVIKNYTQATNNIFNLITLADVALGYLKQTLELDDALIFLLDTEDDEQYYFRTLPVRPATVDLVLAKRSIITQRLVHESQALAQYRIDISPHFKDVPAQELKALQDFNLEWFVPIQKQGVLIGVFGLGPKYSRQPYSAEDMRLLAILADQTALVLENAKLVDRVQQNLQEVNRTKSLMDNVFDSMDNGVITIDLNKNVTLMNRAAQTILALPEGNYLGQPYREVTPALADTVFRNLVTNVLTDETHYTDYEMMIVVPERGRVNLKLSLVPFKDTGNTLQGVTVVLDDVTETKRLQAVRDMFRRYVSPAVVDRLPADPSKLQLGGHRQTVTILFADIRGFTTYGEGLTPEALVDTLNEYLSIAARSILMYEGTLDKFMGDAVMGVFNAPLEQTDHVLRAVRAATAMQQSILEYHNSIDPEQQLDFGVGLHVGEAVVGNIGMSDRMDYTAIGDTVNLAKRIQENTPGNQILISDAVYNVVKDSISVTYYEEITVKGRQQPVKTYQVLQNGHVSSDALKRNVKPPLA